MVTIRRWNNRNNAYTMFNSTHTQTTRIIVVLALLYSKTCNNLMAHYQCCYQQYIHSLQILITPSRFVATTIVHIWSYRYCQWCSPKPTFTSIFKAVSRIQQHFLKKHVIICTHTVICCNKPFNKTHPFTHAGDSQCWSLWSDGWCASLLRSFST